METNEVNSDVERIVKKAALECAASMYGWSHGGSAGATEDIRYFKANQILPGFQHCINERMYPFIMGAVREALTPIVADNERLRAELKSLKDTHGTLLTALEYNRKERDQLRAENDELRKDKERVDWCAKFRGTISSWSLITGEINFNIQSHERGFIAESTDLRAVIDQARANEQKENQ